MKNIFKITITISISILLFLFNACTKDVESPTPPSTDKISGKTVRYTVLVVPGENSGFKSSARIDSAIVSLVMNDSIYSVATDTNGLAAFNNIAAGVVAVTVRYVNYTTANLVVDLSAPTDTGYDSNNLRNAATMVVLFPTTGEGTATINGRVFADLDLTTPGLETAPVGIKVSCLLESGQLHNFVNHTGDGEILSMSYQPVVFPAITNSNSDYSIIVPATGSGLKIVISADDFAYDQITGTGTSMRKIFKATKDTISVISGMTSFVDIIYN